MEIYFERGGLRWGSNFWYGSNATWPFATLKATPQNLDISVGIGPLRRTFAFNRSDIQEVSIKSGLISKGLKVTHLRSDCPPVIVFWTFRPRRLLSEMAALGYPTH